MSKGGEGERVQAKLLSRWWSTGLGLEESDAIFWRTSQSGGRATIRHRKGLKTPRSHGDLIATDPIGDPFIQMFTVEIKTGYSKDHLHVLLDKPPRAKEQTWEGWMSKTARTAKAAGSVSWLVIGRRNKCRALAVLPYYPAVDVSPSLDFGGHGCQPSQAIMGAVVDGSPTEILVLPLDLLLQALRPQDILGYLERQGRLVRRPAL